MTHVNVTYLFIQVMSFPWLSQAKSIIIPFILKKQNKTIGLLPFVKTWV